MANIYGREMKKADVLRYAGNLDQIAGIRHEEILDDRSRGIKVYNVNNSVIEYTLTESKALDVFDFKYKGMGLCFKSKAGLVMPGTLDANGWNFLRAQASGGLIYSCGFSNVGLFGTSPKWGDYDMFHGRLRTLPATNLCAKTYWEGDDYYLSVSGEMRECGLFKENLAIRREVKTKLGSKSFTLCTEVENEAFDETPIMHMLHVNSGFPLVDKDTKLIAIDGVQPNNTTVADGSYKYHTYYYAVMRADEPEDSSARKVVDWILSDEGQQLAEDSGYVKLGK